MARSKAETRSRATAYVAGVAARDAVLRIDQDVQGLDGKSICRQGYEYSVGGMALRVAWPMWLFARRNTQFAVSVRSNRRKLSKSCARSSARGRMFLESRLGARAV